MNQSARVWKMSFLFLLSLLFTIFIGCYFYITYYLPNLEKTHNVDVGLFDYGVLEYNSTNEGEAQKVISEFTLLATKEDLNRFIQHYLQQGNPEPNHLNYQISLKDQVWIEGTAKIWSYDLPFTMILEPRIVNEGDLLLEAQQILMGDLNLPIDLLLRVMKYSYPLPKWITINEKENEIIFSIQQEKIKDQFTVKVNKFDLAEESFEFMVRLYSQ